jgi:chloramphenicol 3-O phosphotransferase
MGTLLWYSSHNQKSKAHIIYLNGPSSAGKTTLARELQNKLEQPFLVLGIDQMIFMMPAKLNDWQHETEALGFSWLPVKDERGITTAYKIHLGPFGKHMVRALKDIAVTLARSGHNLIIDDVSFGKEQVNEWRKALKDFNVLWVGITAPLEIIEKREKERADRKIGSARYQAEHVHTGVIYDRMIDTYQQTLEENVALIEQLLQKLGK